MHGRHRDRPGTTVAITDGEPKSRAEANLHAVLFGNRPPSGYARSLENVVSLRESSTSYCGFAVFSEGELAILGLFNSSGNEWEFGWRMWRY